MTEKSKPIVSTKRVLSYLWSHVWRYRSSVIFLMVAMIIGVGAQTVTPWLFKVIIDQLTEGPAAINGINTIFLFLFFYVITKFIAQTGWRVAGYFGLRVQSRAMVNLQEEGFAYTLGHSYEFFTNNFTGSLVRKIGRIARAFERVADEIEFRFVPAAIVLIGTFIGLFLRLPLIAFIFIAWVVVFVSANFLMMRWKLKYDIERASVDTLATAELADAMTNNISIKLFNGVDREKTTYRQIMDRWQKLMVRSWSIAEISFAVQGVMMIGIEGSLFYFGIKYWERGLLSVGDLVLIQNYLLIVSNNLWDIGRSFRNVYEGVADAREMMEILDLPYEVQDIHGAKKLKVTKGEISFNTAGFNYNETRTIFKKLNLNFAPGEKVALVGASGAGKTSLIKLLYRFYDLTSGNITIDGQDIAKVTQDSLRQAISQVPQESILFHRTILENIRYGRPGSTREEVKAAAKKAQCHHFISELPDGYDTLVGERGVKLSGGERQRVAIARAILKNAPILILDEATSSLDSESEQLIQMALRELMKGKTTIVVAHRLSTIMMMDRIVVMESGKIIDQGTHDELLQRAGVYKKLWSIQAGGFLG